MTEDMEDGQLARARRTVRNFAEVSDALMELLELATALVMVALFAIGVYDLVYKLYLLVSSGSFVNAQNVVDVIDTALLLLIIVEIYRTVVAYFENMNVLPLVINVALIAMARKVISFRAGEYPTYGDALTAAGAYALLLGVVVGTFFLVHHSQEETDFDVYMEPFSSVEDRLKTENETESTSVPAEPDVKDS